MNHPLSPSVYCIMTGVESYTQTVLYYTGVTHSPLVYTICARNLTLRHTQTVEYYMSESFPFAHVYISNTEADTKTHTNYTA